MTFSRNDQKLIEICTVALHFGLDICQDLYRLTSKVLRCPTVISHYVYTVHTYIHISYKYIRVPISCTYVRIYIKAYNKQMFQHSNVRLFKYSNIC